MSAIFHFNVFLVPSFTPVPVTINKPGPMSLSKVLKEGEFSATMKEQTGMEMDSLKIVDLGKLDGGELLDQKIGENLWIVFIPGYGVSELAEKIKVICAIKGMTTIRRKKIIEPLGSFMADADMESLKSFSEFLLDFIKQNLVSEEGNSLREEFQELLTSMEQFMCGGECEILKGFVNSADCPSPDFFERNLQIILDFYSGFMGLFERFINAWETSSVPKNCVGKEELEELKECVEGVSMRVDSSEQEMSNVKQRLREVEENLEAIEELREQLNQERKAKEELAQYVGQLEGEIVQLKQNFEMLLSYVRAQTQSSEEFKKALGESIAGLNQARGDVLKTSQTLQQAYAMCKK
jgi:hypothetical protein